MATFTFHIYRALAAAVFGDAGRARRTLAAAMPLLPMSPGSYATALAHLLRGLALRRAGQDGGARPSAPACLAELDGCREWLARRAADAPANFGHLVRWLDAERAWAVGDSMAAVGPSTRALDEVARRRRPWHRR